MHLTCNPTCHYTKNVFALLLWEQCFASKINMPWLFAFATLLLWPHCSWGFIVFNFTTLLWSKELLLPLLHNWGTEPEGELCLQPCRQLMAGKGVSKTQTSSYFLLTFWGNRNCNGLLMLGGHIWFFFPLEQWSSPARRNLSKALYWKKTNKQTQRHSQEFNYDFKNF